MNRRVPVVYVLPLALLLGLSATPAALAADNPQLSATTQAGKEIDLTGTGFPANSTVMLVIERNGVPLVSGGTGAEGSGTQTLKADASGSFAATIPAGPGLGGRYTLIATSGAARATLDVVAVEAAGGLAGGTKPTPPPTDTVATATSSRSGGFPWPAVALVALAAILAALVASRAQVRRRG